MDTSGSRMVLCSQVELEEIITSAVATALTKAPQVKNQTSKTYVYGLGGLARLLNCSHPTAQRIKDSGKIPYQQAGRKLVFDSEAVLTALNKKGGTK